jgi:hypothetical protein
VISGFINIYPDLGRLHLSHYIGHWPFRFCAVCDENVLFSSVHFAIDTNLSWEQQAFISKGV